MFTLKFETINAAFEGDDIATESARILRAIAEKLERGIDREDGASGVIHDLNGNNVGFWDLPGIDGDDE